MMNRSRMLILMTAALLLLRCAAADRAVPHDGGNRRPAGYPSHWWAPVDEENAPGWEIFPREALPGEVILSKRNELGLLSNFAHTPFTFRGESYESMEGFWQMMKYPEGPDDPRAKDPSVRWIHTREEVSRMVGFEAKEAGDLATENMKSMGIDWVTFEGERMPYWTAEKGEHYYLIVSAAWAKVMQNDGVRRTLLATGNLDLRPDHHQRPYAPPAWRYCRIYMEIRAKLQLGDKPNR